MQDQQIVNVFKGLVIDAVHKANSGHPGGPMSSMDLAYLLWTESLRFDPDDPEWRGRDRFILSAGHMSMLQYAMLYGTGWLEMDDLKQFRQLHSRTPGHPENFMTPGVECTTGPLGQGAGMSVGFAVASSHLAAVLDKDLFNYRTWALVSDGDLQEGIALGAASTAGHLKLSNLTWIYDSNDIQLAGPTAACVSDDVEKVFTGFGWKVMTIDGHDHAAIRKAYAAVKATPQGPGKPTLIIAKTRIGKGCVSLEGSSKTHGSPLPGDERTKTKAALGLPAEDFYCPKEAVTHFRRNFETLRAEAKSWRATLERKLETDQTFRKAWQSRFDPPDVQALPKVKWATDKAVATRNAFGDIIKEWAPALPALFGGSADLAPSNMTEAYAKAVGDYTYENRAGRNLNFGVREFPMSALANGIALHGGLIPFDATFLAFADYSRGALRLGAIQRARVIHEFTHDSFHVGEDGPTHQPIEQVMSLRAIPDLFVVRPADPQETEALMRVAVGMELPSAFCLTRQKLPYLTLPAEKIAAGAAKGAYVVKEHEGGAGDPEMIFLATGSEVSLALAVAAKLPTKKIRVVSMPCWELFDAQSASYKQEILPKSVKRRVSFEAGTTLGWAKWTGLSGLNVGIDHYGASAPAEILSEEFGFTVEKVLKRLETHSFD
jgi:transketolase